VGGVRTSNVKERSGRTVMRAGMGVPVMKWAVRALNSYQSNDTVRQRRSWRMGEHVLCRNPWILHLWNLELDRRAARARLGLRRR
jgi:hypothetical protein